MVENLRDPILFPNWVWVVAGVLLLLSVAVSVALLLAHRYLEEPLQLRALSQVRRERYERQLAQIESDAASRTVRDTHLALGALIRAAASERLRMNVESLSVGEVAALPVDWPALTEALRWCEAPSFGVGQADVATGIARARKVVEQ